MARKLIKDLQPVTTYAIQVRAVSPDAVGKWSRKFNITTIDDDVLPNVPTGISWVPVGDSFQGEWNKVTTNTLGENINVERYEVELTGNPGAIVKYASVPQVTEGNTVTFNFSYLKNIARFGTAKKDVSFRVRAINKRGKKSDWSASYGANNTAPAVPGNLTATANKESISLKWDAVADDDVDGYRVYLSTTGVNGSYARIYQGYALNFTWPTAMYDTDHYFYVTAYDTFGMESAASVKAGPVRPISSFVVDTTPPAVPSALAATLSRSGSVATANLSWTFDATATDNKDIQGFAIKWYKSGDASNFHIDNATKDARTLSISLPEAYADYQFQIASIDAVANYSAWSTAVSLTGSVPGAPPQTVGVTATAGLDNLQLSWTPSTHDDVKYGGYYEVQVAKDSGFTTGLLTYQTGNTNISVSGLVHDTVYYYRVRAVDVGGLAGPYSTTASATTSGFAASSPTDGLPPSTSPAATLSPGIGLLFASWAPVSNADLVTYEVHISTTSTFTPTLGGATKVAETPGTSVTLSKDAAGAALSYSSTYYVRIIAKDKDTTSGNAPAAGTVSAGVSPRKAGTGDITSIIADQIATGSLGAAIITIASGGAIQSTGYSPGTSGFKISDTVVDIRSGTVGFNTLAAGTMSTTGLTIGAGGSITVDSTGEIRSNTYSPNTTGWRISSAGIELNDANSKVKAAAVVGDTISGRVLTINSGGYIQSSNWNSSTGTGFKLDYNGFTMYNGTLYGSSVTTNSLTSISTDSTTGQPLFSINAGGYAQLAGAYIIGPTVLGSAASTSHYIKSYNFNSSTNTGWQIDATGKATFHNMQIGPSTGGGMNFLVGSGYAQFQITGGTTTQFTHNLYANDDLQLNLLTNTFYVQGNSTTGGHLSTQRDVYVGRYLNVDTIKPNVGSQVQFNSAVNMNGNNLLQVNTITLNGTGGAINGGVSLNGGPTVNAGITINGGITMGTNPTVATNGWTMTGGGTWNGGPTFGGIIKSTNLAGTLVNVQVNTNGELVRASSSRRFKENIVDMSCYSTDTILSLTPVTFTRKDEADNPFTYAGFIAEDAEDLGLDPWVSRDRNGIIDGFRYDNWVAAQQVVLREHQDEIVALKAQVAELAARLDNLQ